MVGGISISNVQKQFVNPQGETVKALSDVFLQMEILL